MIFGDFNANIDASLDRSQITSTHTLQLQVRTFFEKLGLQDIWRDKHLSERDYTYHSGRLQTYSRLDVFFGTGRVSKETISIEIGQRLYSDHSPVMIKWKCPREPARPFLWCLNNYLPEDREITEQKSKENK